MQRYKKNQDIYVAMKEYYPKQHMERFYAAGLLYIIKKIMNIVMGVVQKLKFHMK